MVVPRLAGAADLRGLQDCGAVMGPGVLGWSVVDDGRGSLRRNRELTAAAKLKSRRRDWVGSGTASRLD